MKKPPNPITLTPAALEHLHKLRQESGGDGLLLRMGVKSGGCSGMSCEAAAAGIWVVRACWEVLCAMCSLNWLPCYPKAPAGCAAVSADVLWLLLPTADVMDFEKQENVKKDVSAGSDCFGA